MTTPQGQGHRKNENQSTYFVYDKNQQKDELARLVKQDRLLTTAMGGVLAEQTEIDTFHRILDIACGSGGWVLDAARTYPTLSVTGIDISQRMIEHGRAVAEAEHLADRVQFQVMDALCPLAFPDASFDLVNMRLAVSFLRTWDWSQLFSELRRITRPGGSIRLTETEVVTQSTSPALTRLQEMAVGAFFRAGHLFTQESVGLIAHLEPLFIRYGMQGVQTKHHTLQFRAGTEEGQYYREDMLHVYRVMRPFLRKWGAYDQDQEYDALYRQAQDELRQPDFQVTWNFLTIWGKTPL